MFFLANKKTKWAYYRNTNSYVIMFCFFKQQVSWILNSYFCGGILSKREEISSLECPSLTWFTGDFSCSSSVALFCLCIIVFITSRFLLWSCVSSSCPWPSSPPLVAFPIFSWERRFWNSEKYWHFHEIVISIRLVSLTIILIFLCSKQVIFIFSYIFPSNLFHRKFKILVFIRYIYKD